MKQVNSEKKQLKMPDTIVILVGMLIVICLLTFILPAGSFDFAEDGKTVIAGTYHYVEGKPAGLVAFLEAFYKGMNKGASVIFITLLIGGAFRVLEDTGTIRSSVAHLIQKTGGNHYIILPVVGLMMAALGSVGAGNNIALAFAPIMVMICKRLKLDPIMVVAALYMPSSTGTVSSPIEPFNTMIGQEIAGIPIMSGAGVRLIMWFVFVGICIWYSLRYATNIRKDPSKSITGCYTDSDNSDGSADFEGVAEKFNIRHMLCLAVLAIIFIVYAYGTIKFSWGMSQLGTAMMVLTFAAGIIGAMTPNSIAKSFTEGVKTMSSAAVIIGLANALSVVMTDSNIIHTIVNALSIPLAALPAALSAVGMFLVNLLLNLFISSSSGHAYVIMPLMAPLADVVGISRQVAVSAYCLGEGLGNPLFPTAGLFMGVCAIAGVRYDKWMKFIIPLTIINIVVGSAFLMIAQMLGWS
ncbi:MAG: YfcC family protein [Anaerotruncus sp.]|nr:YfcC family protein [Anaerotruncus sp.]